MPRKRATVLFMRLFTISILLFFFGCSQTVLPKEKSPTDYKSCVTAGFPVIETDPSQCFAPDKVFEAPPKIVKSLEQKQPEAAIEVGPVSGTAPEGGASPQAEVSLESCKNICGDGICQQIVCEGTGCPCAEDPTNCTKDCVAHP